MRRRSLTVRQCRAEILLDSLLAAAPPIFDRDAIPSLSRVAGWRPEILDAAICDLVDDSRITEDAHGNLLIVPRRAA